MPRIRSIKPEFWTSEQVTSVSMQARLMFIGIWNFSDDAGVHPANVRRLKMEVFPGDDISVADVQKWIDELKSSIGCNDKPLLEEYEVDGVRYWRVTGWNAHQKIDQGTYRFPLPDGTVPQNGERRRGSFGKCAPRAHRAHDAQAADAHTSNGARSSPESTGVEDDTTGRPAEGKIQPDDDQFVQAVRERANAALKKLGGVTKDQRNRSLLWKCSCLVERGKLSEDDFADSLEAVLRGGKKNNPWAYLTSMLEKKAGGKPEFHRMLAAESDPPANGQAMKGQPTNGFHGREPH